MSIVVAIIDNELERIILRKGIVASCTFVGAYCEEEKACEHNIVFLHRLIVGALLPLDHFHNTMQRHKPIYPRGIPISNS